MHTMTDPHRTPTGIGRSKYPWVTHGVFLMLISSVSLQCFTIQYFLRQEGACLESEGKSNHGKGLVGIATTNVAKKETKSHLDNIYAPNHASSFQQLETVRQDHPNTPGAHFVKLRRQYIHVAPGAEE